MRRQRRLSFIGRLSVRRSCYQFPRGIWLVAALSGLVGIALAGGAGGSATTATATGCGTLAASAATVAVANALQFRIRLVRAMPPESRLRH